MQRRTQSLTLVAVAAAALWLGGQEPVAAQGPIFARPQYDLFHNYYLNPNPVEGVGAGLYPSPIYTPPYVGHTYYTYQPLMPHEFMYPHAEVYRRYNTRFSPIPLNTTRVIYW